MINFTSWKVDAEVKLKFYLGRYAETSTPLRGDPLQRVLERVFAAYNPTMKQKLISW